MDADLIRTRMTEALFAALEARRLGRDWKPLAESYRRWRRELDLILWRRKAA